MRNDLDPERNLNLVIREILVQTPSLQLTSCATVVKARNFYERSFLKGDRNDWCEEMSGRHSTWPSAGLRSLVEREFLRRPVCTSLQGPRVAQEIHVSRSAWQTRSMNAKPPWSKSVTLPVRGTKHTTRAYGHVHKCLAPTFASPYDTHQPRETSKLSPRTGCLLFVCFARTNVTEMEELRSY